MALVKCPECGKEISDKSKECIHCGYPIKEYFDQLELTEQKSNTKCNFNGSVVDFSDIIPRFKDKYSFDVFDALYSKFMENNIDICHTSIMEFIRKVMTTHIIPKEFNHYKTQTEFIEFVKNDLPNNVRCVIKENDVSYDLSPVKESLNQYGYCDKNAIKHIKLIPELSSQEKNEFIHFLNDKKYIPYSYPYDMLDIIEADTINYIINYWRKDTEAQQPTLNTNRKPHCPNCGSENIKKISFTSRAVGVMAVGLLSSSIGKTFKCKSCGYKW